MTNVNMPVSPVPRRGLRIAMVIVSVMLAFSIMANLVMLLFLALLGASAFNADKTPAERVRAETIHKGGSDIVAIVPVSGTVDGSMTEQMFDFCEYIKRDSHIKAVVLEMNTPGGGVTASDEIHHLFTNLRQSGKKIVVSMGAVAASGGYYISMASEKIYAQPTTLTGSIGVIWPAFEVSQLMKNVGVTPEFIKSNNAAEFKDAGSPFKPFTDKDREYIRALVNNAQARFSSVVAAGRTGRLKKPVAEVAIGKIFTADEALSLGLVDEIAYLDEACAKTSADLGIADATIVRLKIKSGLLEALMSSAPMGSSKVELKVDPKSLENLAKPQLEYRAPEFQ